MVMLATYIDSGSLEFLKDILKTLILFTQSSPGDLPEWNDEIAVSISNRVTVADSCGISKLPCLSGSSKRWALSILT